MNYIGSKLKLSPWIKREILNIVGEDISQKVFCDLFAGTGIIGRTFKNSVKSIISNDIETYSYMLNKNYIGNALEIDNKDYYIELLNNLHLRDDGFIYKHYCIGSGSNRQYFSDTNGKKIDTIRTKIEQLKLKNNISDELYYYLIASLLESADKIANTASVYGAYLKHLKANAKKDFVLIGAEFETTNNTNYVYNSDSNELIKKISGDILYLDPPYNNRQYGANYHLLNTIAKYDSFVPYGKTGIRDYQKSLYCSKSKVQNVFEDLIKNANFKYIFVSYNNEGLMSFDDIKKIMARYGTYIQINSMHYSRFRSDKSTNRNHKAHSTYEYLHVLEKNI